MRLGDDTFRSGDAYMDAVYIFSGGETRLELENIVEVEEAFLKYLILCIEEPFLPFGMGR